MPQPSYTELVEVVVDARDRLRDIGRMCQGMEDQGRSSGELERIYARAFYGRQHRALRAVAVEDEKAIAAAARVDREVPHA
jgi:hypothetical protein